VVPLIAAPGARILNEERYLAINLAGYADYTHKVRHRLIPFVWCDWTATPAGVEFVQVGRLAPLCG
jgi:hypothetical protein